MQSVPAVRVQGRGPDAEDVWRYAVDAETVVGRVHGMIEGMRMMGSTMHESYGNRGAKKQY